MKPRKPHRHECVGGCGRVIRWGYAMCSDCSWRGFPVPNFEWKHHAEELLAGRKRR